MIPSIPTCRPEGLLGAPSGVTRSVLGVEVVEGPVPSPWQAPISLPFFCADERRALWTHGNVRCYVENGDTVVVEAPDESMRQEYDYMVYAMALLTLLVQRRRFSLHASAVVSPEGECVAIMGESMAGKSTTVVELINRGWTFVCDDVVEVEFDEEGRAWMVPHDRPVHLSDDAARRLGGDPNVGRPLPARNKRVYRLLGASERRPLDRVVRLRVEDDGTSVTSRRTDATESAWLIGAHSDLRGLCHLDPLRGDFFSWVTRLAGTVPCYDLARPESADTVTVVAEAMAVRD